MSESKKFAAPAGVLTYDDVRSVSKALEHYTKGALLEQLWKRPALSPRDRSVVTVAALIARIQSAEVPYYFALALDNGVRLLNSPRSSRTLPSMRAGATPWLQLPLPRRFFVSEI